MIKKDVPMSVLFEWRNKIEKKKVILDWSNGSFYF